MKGILVIIDGMGDLPHDLLKGQTPLEAAHKPNLNTLASKSELGIMDVVRKDYVPGSSDAILSIFGNNHSAISRGVMEAEGAGIKLVRGDLVLRTNFATIDDLKSKTIIDRRAGRTLTTKEAEILARSLNKNVKLPVKFIFKPTLQHRGVLVLRGGFSDMISNVDIEYTSRGKNASGGKFSLAKPLDEEDNSAYTANIVNEFLMQSFEILNKHPINHHRIEKGLLPANFFLTRGAGVEKGKVLQYPKWAASVYMPLEMGFARFSGMQVYSFKYPQLKNFDVYQNLHDGLKKACKFAIKSIKKAKRKNLDYVYVHIKEPDIPGHDNKPLEKKAMIEYIDKTLMAYIVKFSSKNKVMVCVTADHSTPCKLKSHSGDPVPVLLYNGKDGEEKTFNESSAAKGNLGKIQGKELLKKIGFKK